jgi:hypothetical protein
MDDRKTWACLMQGDWRESPGCGSGESNLSCGTRE